MQYLGIMSLVFALATTTRWFQRAWRVDIPKKRTSFQILWCAGLLLGVAAVLSGSADGFAYWGIGIAIVMLYFSYTGGQRENEKSVEVGDKFPAFTAFDDSDNTFDSASLQGSRVLLKFFRGHW